MNRRKKSITTPALWASVLMNLPACPQQHKKKHTLFPSQEGKLVGKATEYQGIGGGESLPTNPYRQRWLYGIKLTGKGKFKFKCYASHRWAPKRNKRWIGCVWPLKICYLVNNRSHQHSHSLEAKPWQLQEALGCRAWQGTRLGRNCWWAWGSFWGNKKVLKLYSRDGTIPYKY